MNQLQKKRRQNPKRTIDLWLLDMDDTLYGASGPMFEAIHARMERYIAKKLNITADKASALQHAYWARYGATFLGLERCHGLDPEDFMREAHDFDVAALVQAKQGQRLRAILKALPGKKVLITNGPRSYALSVLRALRVQDGFDDIVTANDMHALGRWRCKPDAVLMTRVLARFHVDPARAVMVEDSLNNLRVAKRLGMRTVWCMGYRREKGAIRPVMPHWVDTSIEHLGDLTRMPWKLM